VGLRVHLVAVALVASSAAMVAVHVDGTSVAPVSPPAEIRNAYDRLPMSFAPNEGQAEPEADFVSGGAGYRVSLSAAGPALSLQQPRATVAMRFVGANPAARPEAQDRLAGRASYLLGRDPTRWRRNLPTYAKVVYGGVYPGIDAVYRGEQGALAYDLVVAPGADPRQVRLAVDGADGVSIDAAGDLVVHMPGGDVIHRRPRVFQEVAGVRRHVAGEFTLPGPLEVGFALGAYDRSRPLVIDPTVVYSTFLGGSGNEQGGYSVAADFRGDAYVAGGTAPPPGFAMEGSTDFPTTPGAFQPGPGDPHGDAFVTKLSADGSTLLYSTYIGGDTFDDAAGIAVDFRGFAYVRGVTNSFDFPTTPGSFQPQKKGPGPTFNAWVAKLSPDGSSLAFSTYLGGSGFNSGSGIAIDRRGSAYVPGVTGSPDFPTTPGAFDRTFEGELTVVPPLCTRDPAAEGPCDFDAFVSKLTPDGSALEYSTLLGGARLDVGFSIAVDTAGRAHVTGDTLSADFPTTGGSFDTTFNGAVDAWVTKLNRDGSALVYSTFLGGGGFDDGLGIALDPSGSAYVTGGTESPDFPATPAAFQSSLKGQRDGYLANLSRDGASLGYSTLLGGSGFDYADAVAVDHRENAYITGATNSADFPTTPGALQPALGDPEPGNPDLSDAYVTKVDPSGSVLAYSTYLGGSGYDQALGIAVDVRGDVYVTGVTESTDFPTTPGAVQAALRGEADGFVTKLSLLLYGGSRTATVRR